MRGRRVLDPQIEMHLLLRCPVRPIGGNMVRRELNAEPPLAVDHHVVPIVLRFDRAAQQAGPEGALGGQIGSVEHDDLSLDLHTVLLVMIMRSSFYHIPRPQALSMSILSVRWGV